MRFDYLRRVPWPMLNHHGVAWLITCMLLLSSTQVHGLSKLADQKNVLFNHLGTEDGLSQATVTAIAQDHQGFIWIGTQDGLNRYNGYKLESFFHSDDDPTTISRNHIRDILCDWQGTIWVATDYGINRFDERSNSFETLLFEDGPGTQATEHNAVKVLLEDSKQRVWIGTDIGLIMRSSNGSTVHYHHDPTDPTSLGQGAVLALFEDSKARLWVGTHRGGLNLFDPESNSFIHYRHDSADEFSISGDYVRDILEDDKGRIWLAMFKQALSILDPDTGKFTNTTGPVEAPISRPYALLKDQNNVIWVGSEVGLYRSINDEFTAFTHDPTDPHSLGENLVKTLFQDRGGVIWVGTVNGASKWNAHIETFPHLRSYAANEDSLSSNLITSFSEMSNKNVWIGSYNGINKWDAQKGKLIKLDSAEVGLTDKRISTLANQGDVLWVGTMEGGINLIVNDRVESFFVVDENDPQSLSSNQVTRIIKDSQGYMWVATFGAGINKYLGEGKFRRYPDSLDPEMAFSDLKTLYMIETFDGLIWIGTQTGGVVILDPESGKTRNLRYDPENRNSLSGNDVISLLETTSGIWIGTVDSGLNFYDRLNGRISRIGRSDGLASDSVLGLLEDTDGRIWISGGKGISVYDPGTKTFALYDSTDGLHSGDFMGGSYLKLSDGSFLFGGINGFNVIPQDKIYLQSLRNPYVPSILITGFSKNNKAEVLPEPIYRSERLVLAHDDYVIDFDFAAMDFTAPDKNQFRYKLEGFDPVWVDAKGAHSVTYTNLDPGDYEFKVKGSNNDGVWNEQGTSIKIVVNPPLWATWWAYLAYLFIGLSVLYQAQKANGARLRREAEKRYSERLQLYIESLEEATDCVLIADETKHLMYANNAIKPILGVSPAQAVGRSILSLLFSEASDASLARAGLRRKGRWHGEVSARKGAEYGTTEVTIATVHDDNDNETAYICIARDITDRKKVEAELEEHRLHLQKLVGLRTRALEHEISENMIVQRKLAESLREKELLLKEVHHRVKNNMQVISSLLNIQAETVADELFADLLRESQQRIKSMSLIHENLCQSENLLEIDFDDYINMLANSIHRFYSIPGKIVSLDIQVDNVSLDLETAVPCGLIINELISNSLKHAFKDKQGKGAISVKFNQVDRRYVLEIKDDGVGLPSGFDLEASSSMGMEIVSVLTQQLNGKLRYDSNDGARFEISFPVTKKVIKQEPPVEEQKPSQRQETELEVDKLV